MEWARNELPEPMKYHFIFDMLENIIEYVMDQVDEKDEFIEIMLKIVPEVTKKEWSKYFYKEN